MCLVGASCRGTKQEVEQGLTGIELAVNYSTDLGLDQILVSGRDAQGQPLFAPQTRPQEPHPLTSGTSSVVILLPGSLAATTVVVRADGLSQGTVVVSGGTEVTLVSAILVPATIELGPTPTCGDGVISVPIEQCDDEGNEAGDGCSDVCLVEIGWVCREEPSVCSAGCMPTTCGDGCCGVNETTCNCSEDCGNKCGDGCCNAAESTTSCGDDCGSSCGDGVCSGEETSCGCPEDCGVTTCGDGCCGSGVETQCNCPADCGTMCPDGCCNGGESSADCWQDCGTVCGDAECNGDETPCDCPADCPATGCGDHCCQLGVEDPCLCEADCGTSSCGDNVCCAPAEDNATCPEDCLENCGDEVCASGEGETTSNCPEDCGSPCGDNVCNGDETTASCPQDCGSSCGDTACNGDESPCNCAVDCGDPAPNDDFCCPATENACTSPNDCGPDCGDGFCCGETSCDCASDCAPKCGDSCCDPSETSCGCPGDCDPKCGDGCCDASEDETGCPADCSSVCPDGTCSPVEDLCSCASDCTSSLSTGWFAPAGQLAGPGGDGDGFEETPENAFAADNEVAVDTDGGTAASSDCASLERDSHVFHTFGIDLPAVARIHSVEVRLDASASADSFTPRMCVQLSWDGGGTWSDTMYAELTAVEATYQVGFCEDWGHPFTSDELQDPHLQVRVRNVAGKTNWDFFLDFIAVKVYYSG